MRVLILAAVAMFGWWVATAEVSYFVLGPPVARLPQYLRAGDAMAPDKCAALALDSTRHLMLGTWCERVPMWRHWFNVAQNIVVVQIGGAVALWRAK